MFTTQDIFSIKMTNPEKKNEIIVITGTSTGIGNATAKELAGRGYYVLAGVRREIDADAIRYENIEPVILDITNQAHIDSLVKRLEEDPGKRPLKALINNAAIEINAPLEVLELVEWRRQFDVNVFGQVAMIQALLPALFQSRGTIVNISSIGGKAAMACYGPYASTKFALEGLSDALRRELQPSGVKVIVIEPGGVTSPMSLQVRTKAEKITREMTPEHRSRYGSMMHAMVSLAESYIKNAVPAGKAAEIIANTLNEKRPRTRYTIGKDAAVVRLMNWLLPDRWLDSLLARTNKAHYPKPLPPQ
jgi:NAD(P)-dependent dehydrogenase (short-subunit alcohol dehydrogenase family)